MMYLVLLLWCFLGVGIIADIFMDAIGVICSQASIKKEFLANGKERTVETLVWNGTVANLTLMALGSSAPEILLNVIEVFDLNFYAGSLGPSTIVGSAAFNLLVIMAVCVTALPGNETRKIDDLVVFGMTACSSIFAYVWLLIILQMWTPNVVTLTEACMTFGYFPVLVVGAWLADTGKLQRMLGFDKGKNSEALVAINISEDGVSSRGFDKQEIAKLLKGNISHEDMSEEEIAELAAAVQLQATGGMNRARRRANASRGLYGGKKQKGMNVNLGAGKAKLNAEKSREIEERVQWGSMQYSCKESDQKATLTVNRPVRTQTTALTVEFETVDGSATGGTGFQTGIDYQMTTGTIKFAPGEISKEITITIFEDAEAEADEYFYVDLKNVVCQMDADVDENARTKVTVIDTTGAPTIDIVETDKRDKKDGVPLYEVSEDDGLVEIKVRRNGSSSERVTCKFETVQDVAKAGDDYEDTFENNPTELVFAPNETEKTIQIKIFDDELYEKDEMFTVKLSDGKGAELETKHCKVKITNNDSVSKTTDLLVKHLQINWDAMENGGSSYASQFKDAFAFPSKEDGAVAIVMHILNVPWKFTFAFVPPAAWCGGLPCFFVALALIGGVTAFIGDLAGLLGCSFGLKGSVTAITFVALGTSLPDTFASKAAAMGDPNADSAIGNVTGSNSVNVFLGLGLPWLIASAVWKMEGATAVWKQRITLLGFPELVSQYPSGAFVVPAGALGFSVTVFTICALVCIFVLCLRRKKYGYELGGEGAKPTAGLFVFLWIFYVTLSTIQAYGGFDKAATASTSESSGLGGGWIAVIVVGGLVLLHTIVSVVLKKRKDVQA